MRPSHFVPEKHPSVFPPPDNPAPHFPVQSHGYILHPIRPVCLVHFDNCMYISKEKDEALRKGKLSRGDVVLTTRGTLGNLAFYTDEIPYEHVRINSGMVILRMKKDVLDEVYFIEQFKMQLADIKEKIASGSAQPQLPISTMNKIQILIPRIEIQKQFADFVKQTDKSKFIHQKGEFQ